MSWILRDNEAICFCAIIQSDEGGREIDLVEDYDQDSTHMAECGVMVHRYISNDHFISIYEDTNTGGIEMSYELINCIRREY
ncbi:hypothetical protein [Ammoniphilus resinae]|uniref:Uncharacterized protein n=1 Tax=Ammoniphilus resinae TaxID=861532 RepID=A0ABS4GNC6_9BACL|nr:hypothetical protein [Ammoniphilus resinae]MBP1931787.1 hypothetical protein [Ammoniphilus resinae]